MTFQIKKAYIYVFELLKNHLLRLLHWAKFIQII